MIPKKEMTCITVVFIGLVLIFSAWKVNLWYDGFGDNAFLGQLTENIAKTGRPVTQSMASIDIVLRDIVVASPEIQCAKPFPTPESAEINYFKQWHTYGILYLLSPLVGLFGSTLTLSVFTILSFFTILFLVYLFLRERKVDPATAVCFLFLVSIHPAWSYSIQGQTYVDRFFVGLGFLLLYVLDKYPSKKWWILFLSILCASLSDRFGILVGGILIGKEVLFWFSKKSWDRFNFFVGFICTIASVLLVKFYVHHPHYGSFASSMSPSAFIGNLKNPVFFENLVFFMTLNILFYGIFAAFSWRYFLLSIGLMLPNILGSIGGAEKTGFFTHYHSTYFPLLIFAAVDGFAKIYNSKSAQKFSPLKRSFVFSGLVLVFAIGIGGGVTGGDNQFTFKQNNLQNMGLVVGLRDSYSYLFGEKMNALQNKLSMLEIVASGKSVSTVESLMPIFALTRQVHLYPIGLDTVDFLVLPVLNPGENVLKFGGAISYLVPYVDVLNSCFTERIYKLYDTSAIKIIQGYAVIPKKNLFQ